MFAELHQTLAAALATGKIGTPISVRVHLQLPEPDADLDAALDSIITTTTPAFSQTLNTLQSRVHADGQQWNVLMRSANGRSLFVTLGRGSARVPVLELLVVGNHGVIRLEGGDVLCEAVGGDGDVPAARTTTTPWAGIINQSHDDGIRVTLNQ